MTTFKMSEPELGLTVPERSTGTFPAGTSAPSAGRLVHMWRHFRTSRSSLVWSNKTSSIEFGPSEAGFCLTARMDLTSSGSSAGSHCGFCLQSLNREKSFQSDSEGNQVFKGHR